MKELKILENSYKEIISNAKILYMKNVSNLLLHKFVEFNYEWSNPFDTTFNDIIIGEVFKLSFEDDGIYALIKVVDTKKSNLIKLASSTNFMLYCVTGISDDGSL